LELVRERGVGVRNAVRERGVREGESASCRVDIRLCFFLSTFDQFSVTSPVGTLLCPYGIADQCECPGS